MFKSFGVFVLGLIGLVAFFVVAALFFGWLTMLGLGVLAAAGVIPVTVSFGTSFAIGLLYTGAIMGALFAGTFLSAVAS